MMRRWNNVMGLMLVFLLGTIVVVMLGGVRTLLQRSAIKEQLIEHFRSDGLKLTGRLKKMRASNVVLTEHGLDRWRRAIKILENREFDDTVVVLKVGVSPGGVNPPSLIMEYVDEKATVAQFNFVGSTAEPNSLGNVLIPSNEFSPPERRHVGVYPLWLHLKADDSLSVPVPPYSEVIDETRYLNISRPVFEEIMQGKGHIILLDKMGSVLDKVSLTEADWFEN